MKRFTFLTLLVIALAGPSCVVTDVGNPEEDKSDVEMDFAGYTETETQTNALTLPSNARIDRAWIVLSDFRFRSAAECEEDVVGGYDVTEPVVIDLLAREPVYEAPMFTKPAGDYCKLDVSFAPIGAEELPEGAPSDLAGLSVLVEGARADGVEFRIEGGFDSKFHLKGDTEDIALQKGHEHLIVGFVLDEWLNEAKLDNVESEETILINDESNPELLGDFEAAVKRSARMFRDHNDNRRLDANEKGQAIASSAQENAGEQGLDTQGQQSRAPGR